MATKNAPNMPYVFVSYASADRERVLSVVDVLTRAGIPVWIDREGIHGGANYGEEIAEAIKGAVAFVLMTSAVSLASRNVKQEIALAWDFERPYVPLLLEPVTIPTDVRYWLTTAQWVEVFDKPEGEWLPAVLTALAPLGIAPTAPVREEETRLAGREQELALLHEKLAAAKEGKGGLVLIGGEAGIGKTTLAEALLHDARAQGFTVLEGHCFDLAETPPYGPWIDLFAHYVATPASPPLPDAFVVRGTVGAVASQIALFVAVEDFLRAAAAQRPAVVLLDDLHWADPASLDLLRFLARSVAGLPLLILVTYRSNELTRTHPLSPLLPQLAREASAERLDLGRLDDNAVRSLIVERYGVSDGEAGRLAAYLRSRAEGNALFVGELLRSLEEAGTLHREGGGWLLGDLAQIAVPALLRQVIDGRLGRLDAESQRLLAVAAVVGHEVPLDLWATVAGTDEDALLAVIERGVEARLLEESPDGTRVRFVHALIREALYEGLLATRRRRMHRAVAEALIAIVNPDPDVLAYHFQQAGDARAAEWLIKAGTRAQVAYAWGTAAVRYEAALALIEGDDDRVQDRARLLFRSAVVRRFNDSRQSLAYLEEAARLVQGGDDRLLAARIQLYYGLVQCYLNNLGPGVAELQAGADALDALSPAERVGNAEPDGADATVNRGTVALWLANAGRLDEAEAMGERFIAEHAADTVDGVAGAPLADAFFGLGITYGYRGRPEAALHAYERAYDLNAAVGHYLIAGAALLGSLSIVLRYQTDHVAERERLAGEVEQTWVRVGEVERNLSPRTAWVSVMAVDGRWQTIHELGSNNRTLSIEEFYGHVAFGQGNRGVVMSLIDAWLPAGQKTAPGSVRLQAVAFYRLAIQLAIEESDLVTAKERLDAHDRWLAWSGAVVGQSEGHALWAEYHRQTGDAEQSREHAERALAHATAPRQPLALLAAHRLLGELDTDAGRFADAQSHLDASLELADACAAPFERALTLLAMAEWHAATGKTTDARTLLDEVHAICEPLGAKPTLARAAALAARLTP